MRPIWVSDSGFWNKPREQWPVRALFWSNEKLQRSPTPDYHVVSSWWQNSEGHRAASICAFVESSLPIRGQFEIHIRRRAAVEHECEMKCLVAIKDRGLSRTGACK